jgi:hypothetical protein
MLELGWQHNNIWDISHMLWPGDGLGYKCTTLGYKFESGHAHAQFGWTCHTHARARMRTVLKAHCMV